MFEIQVSRKLAVLSAISSLTVNLGILLGCVPFHPLSVKFSTDGFRRRLRHNIGFLYAFALLALQPVLFIYMPQGLPKIIAKALSENIINYTRFVVWATAETLRRIFYLTHFRAIFDLVRKLSEQQVSVLSICKGSIGLGSFGAIVFTCVYGIAAIVEEVMLAIHDKQVTDGHWAIGVIAAYVHLCWLCSKLLATGLTLVAGEQLIEHYRIVMEELASQEGASELRVVSIGLDTTHTQDLLDKVKTMNGNGNNNINIINGDNDPAKVQAHNWLEIDKMKTLHENFDLYERVVGFLVLIALAENGMIGLVHVYKAITYYEVDALFTVLEHYLSMMLIAHLGQTMKDTVGDARQKMKLILAKTELALLDDENENGKFVDQYEAKVSILQYIVRWKWSFRACDMLDIGYTLFSVIAANTTMLVMFMFSLKISEQTA